MDDPETIREIDIIVGNLLGISSLYKGSDLKEIQLKYVKMIYGILKGNDANTAAKNANIERWII